MLQSRFFICRIDPTDLYSVSQPFGDFRRQKRAQSFIYPSVIPVKPFHFLLAEKLRYDCRNIDMAAGKGFEGEPVTEFRRTVFTT